MTAFHRPHPNLRSMGFLRSLQNRPFSKQGPDRVHYPTSRWLVSVLWKRRMPCIRHWYLRACLPRSSRTLPLYRCPLTPLVGSRHQQSMRSSVSPWSLQRTSLHLPPRISIQPAKRLHLYQPIKIDRLRIPPLADSQPIPLRHRIHLNSTSM